MSIKLPIYLDHNATTPVDPRVLDEMLPFFTERYGNSASTDHLFGTEAADAVEVARARLAKLIGAKPEEIIFTSGATESDNLAIVGTMERYKDKGDHIITCVTEHKAVLETCTYLESIGKNVTYLPVDSTGIVDLEALRDAITNRTVMISIMAANNEIGTLAPLDEIGGIAEENDVILHTDAAQAVGHVPVDVRKSKIGLMSISAHKFYGPKGVGALFIRHHPRRIRVIPQMRGGGHERKIRSGTLNVPGIVGLGKAAEISGNEMGEGAERLRSYTKKILTSFQKNIRGVELNGHPTQRLPHNLNVSIEGLEGKLLLKRFRNELAISVGSACSTTEVKPSHVIMALGYGEGRAYSAVRFGVGRFTSEGEIDFLINEFMSELK